MGWTWGEAQGLLRFGPCMPMMLEFTDICLSICEEGKPQLEGGGGRRRLQTELHFAWVRVRGRAPKHRLGAESRALLSLEPEHVKESSRSACSIEDSPCQKELPGPADIAKESYRLFLLRYTLQPSLIMFIFVAIKNNICIKMLKDYIIYQMVTLGCL